MDEKIKQFRDGIFALETRRFGAVGEHVVSLLYDMTPSGTLEYDLNHQGKRVECKFCRVLKRHPRQIRPDNIITEIMEARSDDRLISFYDKQTDWSVNFAQIKPDCFDELYFGVFFSDCVWILHCTSDEVRQIKGFSDKQHRGNKGEGQFGMRNQDLDEMIKRFNGDGYSYEMLHYLFTHTKLKDNN